MRKSIFRLVAVTVVAVCGGDPCFAGEVTLSPVGPTAGPAPNVFRWKDIAGAVYRTEYQTAYDYASAVVTVTYVTTSNSFQGTLTATGLKPNFAYQMKLVANPGDTGVDPKYVADLTTYEYETLLKVASIGRWWDYTTSQINPPYDSTHQMQSYLLFDHFETDNMGNATKTFYADSSFHVLFTGNGWYNAVVSTVDPDGPPANSTAYGEPYPTPVDVTVGAQNEQGTPGATFLPTGHYEGLKFLLTEESFHESGVGGWWASAMAGWVVFNIGTCTIDDECDDGIECTDDSCRVSTGLCINAPDDAFCEDGDSCTGSEYCDPIDDCVHTLNADCNENDIEDSCDIAAGTSSDCNGNAVPDSCDVTDGTLHDDVVPIGIPDECGACCGPTDCIQATESSCATGDYRGDNTKCGAGAGNCSGIPTLSTWGMLATALLILAAGTIVLLTKRRRVST